MAWTSVASRGTATAIAAGATLSVSPLVEIPVGAIAVVVCGSHSNQTGSGETTLHAVSDTAGNTWTRLRERSLSGTLLNGDVDDTNTSSLWATKITSAIGTGASVTLNTGDAASEGKIIGLYEFSVVAGQTFGIAAGASASAFQADTTVTVSGLSSVERLWIGCGAVSHSGATLTQDADYTDMFGADLPAHTGAIPTSVKSRPGYRIATLTTDTFGWTFGGRDTTLLLVALDEVAAPSVGQPTMRRVQWY